MGAGRPGGRISGAGGDRPRETIVKRGFPRFRSGRLGSARVVVFGCDCGAWYRAYLRTGETMAMPTNALVVGKDGNSSIKALWIDKLEFSRVSSGAVR